MTVSELPGSGPPSPPKGLKTAGRRLWRDVVGVYDLRCDELVILEQACRTVDRIDALELAVGDDLVSTGSMGQPVVSPLVREQREQRIVLSRLVRQLGLPDHDDETEQVARSWRSRRAARERWSPDGPRPQTSGS